MNKGDYELTPKKSLGVFTFNDSIEKYLHLPHTFEEHEDKYSSDGYYFDNFDFAVWVEEGKIGSICCDKYCYWQGQNLIGMLYDDFLTTYKVQPPPNFDTIYLEGDIRGKNQKVYDFDDIDLQIWVWRRKIVTVIASNYVDDE